MNFIAAASCVAFAYIGGRFVREFQQLNRDKARLKEVQAYMDMSKPGSYLEWLSAPVDPCKHRD